MSTDGVISLDLLAKNAPQNVWGNGEILEIVWYSVSSVFATLHALWGSGAAVRLK